MQKRCHDFSAHKVGKEAVTSIDVQPLCRIISILSLITIGVVSQFRGSFLPVPYPFLSVPYPFLSVPYLFLLTLYFSPVVLNFSPSISVEHSAALADCLPTPVSFPQSCTLSYFHLALSTPLKTSVSPPLGDIESIQSLDTFL